MHMDLRSSELQVAPAPANKDPQIEAAAAAHVGAGTSFDLDDEGGDTENSDDAV
jgi:hypothetical protein